MQRKSSFGKYFRAFVHRHVQPKPKYSCSSSSSGSISSLNSHPSSSSLYGLTDLPPAVLCETLQHMNNPFKLWQSKIVSKEADIFVSSKFSRVKKMDVKRVNFDQLMTENRMKDGYGSHEVELDNVTWYIHPNGCKLLMRFADIDAVDIVVDNHWNSKDVVALDEAIGMFRHSVQDIYLDAPIVELIIASLSMIDLDRWYAFLCFMKATNNTEMHLSVDAVHAHFDESDLYFPEGRQLVIRTTQGDSSHLARILDYGVRSRLVVNRLKLDVIKVIVTDVAQFARANKELNRNILKFRCWAGSAGFDNRYQQSYCV